MAHTIRAEQVRDVFDPVLPARSRRWLLRLIARRDRVVSNLAIEFAGPVAASMSFLIGIATGYPALWLSVAAAALIATFVVRHEVTTGGLNRYRQHFVDARSLDEQSRWRLHAVQQALDAVIGSQIHQDGLLDHGVAAADLALHEWQIASRLRDITRLRAEHASSVPGGVPGPKTAAVLDGQLRAITIAEEAMTQRIAQVQRYALEVKAADAALIDWRTAERLARRNDQYLTLVAHTAADDYAISDLAAQTEVVFRTREVFEAHLADVAAAAQPLVFPAA